MTILIAIQIFFNIDTAKRLVNGHVLANPIKQQKQKTGNFKCVACPDSSLPMRIHAPLLCLVLNNDDEV